MPHLLAYLDAGSGSMLLQVLAGGLAAFAVAGRLLWNRILTFLRIRKPQQETPASAAATARPDGAPGPDAS